MSVGLGIVGASGRLGRRVRAAAEEAGWEVVLAAGSSAWDVELTPDVLVDVSSVRALPVVAGYCRRAGVPLVNGVSGLGEADRLLLEELSEYVAVVRAPNFSFGHLLQVVMLEAAASALVRSTPWEATVSERHPRTKADRPSATALELAGVCDGAGLRLGEIASVRGGIPVSDHAVLLAGEGETVTLSHSVADLSAAAAGAVRAAAWALGRRPGLWGMRDVYDLDLDPGPRVLSEDGGRKGVTV